MKSLKAINLTFFVIVVIFLSCQTTEDTNQTNPVVNPEDVFSPEILSILRSTYDLANNQLEITYIGNHGYMFSTKSRKILIDSLTLIGRGYESTSKVILSMMNQAEFPFNHIRWALSTHSHVDHFEVEKVVDFLVANPQGTHLTTLEAEIRLQYSSRYSQISSQSMRVTPDPLSRNRVEIGGLMIDVIRVEHNGRSHVEHVAFLFTLNTIKVLHIGDACYLPTQWEGHGLEGENIDILIAPFWTEWSDEEKPFEIINNYIKPKLIIVSHLDYNVTTTEIEEILNTLEENLPGITLAVFHPTILKQKIFTYEGNTIQVIDKPPS